MLEEIMGGKLGEMIRAQVGETIGNEERGSR